MTIGFRTCLQAADPRDIENLVRATGFFSGQEISIARELADDALASAERSHYRFVLAENDGRLLGYACFGAVPCTTSAWDLYWIAVQPESQGQKLGRELLTQVETVIVSLGGTRIYADTSSRAQYSPTRMFYVRRGFSEAAHFKDFYAPGDDKVVFLKILVPAPVTQRDSGVPG